MRIDLDFTYQPDWTAHAQSMGFGPNGLLGRVELELPEIASDEAPVRWTVRDGDDRIRTLREHAGSLYEPMPKCPLGLGARDMLRMDMRPARDWSGEWGIALDRGLALARIEGKRLETILRAHSRHPAAQDPFLVGEGNLRERAEEARAAFALAGVALVDGGPFRMMPEPVLVRTTLPNGRIRLDVAMRARSPGACEEILPLSDYAEAVEALRASGQPMPPRPLVRDHALDAPAPAPR